MSDNWKVVEEGPYPYFITCSIIRWYPVFVSGPYFKIVLDSLEHMRRERDLLIHAYSIMPTHFHAILTAKANDLSDIMRDYKRFTAGAIFKQAQADNNKLLAWLFKNEVKDDPKLKTKVWQDEFHPEGVKSRKFFLQKANYIHMNPVTKGLVADSVNYYYSSAAAFEGIQTGPLEIDWLEW